MNPLADLHHTTGIRQHIIDRVLARRGSLHLFDQLNARRTALIVVDMQNTFCAPGAPAEVPHARGICAAINRLTAALRARGGLVAWVQHANSHGADGRSDWAGFFDRFVAADVRQRTIESLAPGRDGQQRWSALIADPRDLHLMKNRYSAFIAGSSQIERALRSRGIDTVLIAGTKTNVCCESTARDAMMLDFNVVMLSDACAALSDDEHQTALETCIQNFGDVLSVDETIARLT